MKYAILLTVSAFAGLAWIYYAWLYPVPGDEDLFSVDFDSHQRDLFAEECKRACVSVITFCALAAALFGAAEW